MKKKLSLIILALMLLSSCNTADKPAESTAQTSEITDAESVSMEAAPESDFQYSISGGKAYISKYIGTAEKVIMPETIEGNPITTVDMKFITDTAVKELTLPSGTMIISGKIKSESLEILNIPSTVERIDNIFMNATGLKEINAEEGEFKSVDGILYSADGKTLVCYPNGRTAESFSVPIGVEELEHHSFYGSALTEVVLSDGFSVIDNYAFAECKNLKNVFMPESLQLIGTSAFEKSGISEITLPEGLQEIGSYAFRETNLTELYLPESLQKSGFKIADEDVKISGLYPTEGLKNLADEKNVEWREESELECAIRKAGEIEQEKGRVFTDINGDNFPELLKYYSENWRTDILCYDSKNQEWNELFSSYQYDNYNYYESPYFREYYKRFNEQTGCYEILSDITTYEYTYCDENTVSVKFQDYISSDMTEYTTLTNDEIIDVTGLEIFTFEDFIKAYNPDSNQKFIIITDRYIDEKPSITVNGKEVTEYPYADIFYPKDINLKVDGKDILRGEEVEGVYYSNGKLYFENADISSDKGGIVYVSGLDSLTISLKGENSIECTASTSRTFNVRETTITFEGDGSMELSEYNGDCLCISENATLKIKGHTDVDKDYYSSIIIEDSGMLECNTIETENLTVKDNGCFFADKAEISHICLSDNAALDIKRSEGDEGEYRGGCALREIVTFKLSGNSRADISNIEGDTIFCYPNSALVKVSDNAVLTVDGNADGIGISLEDSAFGTLSVNDNGKVIVRDSEICVFAQAVILNGGTLELESCEGGAALVIDPIVSPYSDFVTGLIIEGELLSSNPQNYEFYRLDYAEGLGKHGEISEKFDITVKEWEEKTE